MKIFLIVKEHTISPISLIILQIIHLPILTYFVYLCILYIMYIWDLLITCQSSHDMIYNNTCMYIYTYTTIIKMKTKLKFTLPLGET